MQWRIASIGAESKLRPQFPDKKGAPWTFCESSKSRFHRSPISMHVAYQEYIPAMQRDHATSRKGSAMKCDCRLKRPSGCCEWLEQCPDDFGEAHALACRLSCEGHEAIRSDMDGGFITDLAFKM